MFRYLRAVAKGRDRIFLCAGDNPRIMAIDFGAVTDPDIIVLLLFNERVKSKTLRPVLANKSVCDMASP